MSLTNPRLPTMANWVCVYAVAISPLIWLISCAVSKLPDPIFANDSPLAWLDRVAWVSVLTIGCVEFGTRILLLVGGLELRALRQPGVRVIQIAAGTMLALVGIEVLLLAAQLVATFSIIASGLDVRFADTVPEPLQDAFAFVSLVLYFAEVGFLAAVSAWLWRHGASLPLRLAAEVALARRPSLQVVPDKTPVEASSTTKWSRRSMAFAIICVAVRCYAALSRRDQNARDQRRPGVDGAAKEQD